VFPNTYHLFEESEGGMKHFGQCDADGRALEELEEWLEEEKVAGRKVAYIFTEFPSNPILVSLDLRRLRGIVSDHPSLPLILPPNHRLTNLQADKYGVPVVIDDTIGSFCNIDVSAVADVIITSITKSLSGYANVRFPLPPPDPLLRHLN
jgi:cystathionine beta-lyase/cystathionine gamma-synthase